MLVAVRSEHAPPNVLLIRERQEREAGDPAATAETPGDADERRGRPWIHESPGRERER
jgi:hypothetical protein